MGILKCSKIVFLIATLLASASFAEQATYYADCSGPNWKPSCFSSGKFPSGDPGGRSLASSTPGLLECTYADTLLPGSAVSQISVTAYPVSTHSAMTFNISNAIIGSIPQSNQYCVVQPPVTMTLTNPPYNVGGANTVSVTKNYLYSTAGIIGGTRVGWQPGQIIKVVVDYTPPNSPPSASVEIVPSSFDPGKRAIACQAKVTDAEQQTLNFTSNITVNGISRLSNSGSIANNTLMEVLSGELQLLPGEVVQCRLDYDDGILPGATAYSSAATVSQDYGQCGEPGNGIGTCQGGVQTVSQCNAITVPACCNAAHSCKWSGSACIGTGSNPSIDCKDYHGNPSGCANFSSPVAGCLYVGTPPPAPCGSPQPGSGWCKPRPSSSNKINCGAVDGRNCCVAVGCKWDSSNVVCLDEEIKITCSIFDGNSDACNRFSSACEWEYNQCSQTGQSCEEPRSCCPGLLCDDKPIQGGKKCCIPSESDISCYVGSQCCNGTCKNHKCEAQQCAIIPTIPSYLDITLDPANKKVQSVVYNLSEKDYVKTPLPNALVFVVNLTDKSNINMCYDATDSDGWLSFPYDPSVPGCTDYWFIFCPLGEAAQSSDSGLLAREICLNATKLNHDTIINPAPSVCLNKEAPALANYPSHILSHNVLYFCNTVPKDYAPLCWPLMLILGLLLGASFAAGKNPFAAFDVSSPRMQRGRQYSARVQNKSFDFLSYAMAAYSAYDSVKSASKKDSKSDDKKGEKDGEKGEGGKGGDGKGDGGAPKKSHDEKTWAGRLIQNVGGFFKRDFQQSTGLGKEGGGGSTDSKDGQAPTTGATGNVNMAISTGSQNAFLSLVQFGKGIRNYNKARKDFRGGKARAKPDIKPGMTRSEKKEARKDARAENKNNKGQMLKNVAEDSKKRGDISGYAGASIGSLILGEGAGTRGPAIAELLKILLNVVLSKYGIDAEGVAKIFEKDSWKGGVKTVLSKLLDLLRLMFALYSIVCEISNYTKIYKTMGGDAKAKGFMDDFNEKSMFKAGNYDANLSAVLGTIDPRMQSAGTGSGIYLPYPLNLVFGATLGGLKIGLEAIASSIDKAVEEKRYGKGEDAPQPMARTTDGKHGAIRDAKGNEKYFIAVPEGEKEQIGVYNKEKNFFTINNKEGESETNRLREEGLPVQELPMVSAEYPATIKPAVFIPVEEKGMSKKQLEELQKCFKNGEVIYAKQHSDGSSMVALSKSKSEDLLRRQASRIAHKMEVQIYLLQSFGDFMGERRKSKKKTAIQALAIQKNCFEAMAKGETKSEDGISLNYDNLKLVQDYEGITSFMMNQLNSRGIAKKAIAMMNNSEAMRKEKENVVEMNARLGSLKPNTQEYKAVEAGRMELEATMLMAEVLQSTGIDKITVWRANRIVQRELSLELDLVNAAMPTYLKLDDPEAREKIDRVFGGLRDGLKGCMEDKGNSMEGDLGDDAKLKTSLREINTRLDVMESKINTFKEYLPHVAKFSTHVAKFSILDSYLTGVMDAAGKKTKARIAAKEKTTVARKGRKREGSAKLQMEADQAKEDFNRASLDFSFARASFFHEVAANSIQPQSLTPTIQSQSFTPSELADEGIISKRTAKKIRKRTAKKMGPKHYTTGDLSALPRRISKEISKEEMESLKGKPSLEDEWKALSEKPKFIKREIKNTAVAQAAEFSSWPEKATGVMKVGFYADMSLAAELDRFSSKIESMMWASQPKAAPPAIAGLPFPADTEKPEERFANAEFLFTRNVKDIRSISPPKELLIPIDEMEKEIQELKKDPSNEDNVQKVESYLQQIQMMRDLASPLLR